MDNFLSNLLYIFGFFAFLFGFLTFFEVHLKNTWLIKWVYPENWFKYIKIYIFLRLDIDDSGCGNVNIDARKLDKKSQYHYSLPFKICIPGNSSLKQYVKNAIITFNTQDDVSLTIYKNASQDLGNRMTISDNDLKIGLQNKFVMDIYTKNPGNEITIKVETIFHKQSNSTLRLTKSIFIIQGLETNEIHVKI